MKKMLNKILLAGVLMLSFSCAKMKYDQELNPTYPISGDWTISVDDGSSVSGPYVMKIYNTANSKDSVWIDDNENYWQTKTKCAVNMKDLTFATEQAQNKYYNSKVSYYNGKVIGKDSIYFEVKFSDDTPAYGNTYKYYGHRRTSYEEYMGLK
jgi:hypothetical protein